MHYNIFEGLTKIDDGRRRDAAAGRVLEPHARRQDLHLQLKKGIKFSDGSAFDASTVKFSFDRAKAPGSTNKAKKAVFDNISSVVVHDPHTVILVLNNAEAMLPFRLGENTAVILHPNTRRPGGDASRWAPGPTCWRAGTRAAR